MPHIETISTHLPRALSSYPKRFLVAYSKKRAKTATPLNLISRFEFPVPTRCVGGNDFTDAVRDHADQRLAEGERLMRYRQALSRVT